MPINIYMERTNKSPYGHDVIVGDIKEWLEYYKPDYGFRQDGFTYIRSEIKGLRNEMQWKRSGRCYPEDVLDIRIVIRQYFEDYKDIDVNNVESVRVIYNNPYKGVYTEDSDNLVNTNNIPIVINK